MTRKENDALLDMITAEGEEEDILRIEHELSKLSELKLVATSHHSGHCLVYILNHLKDMLTDLKKEQAHTKELYQMEKKRKELEDKVLSTRIPVLKDIHAFDKLREEAAQLETELEKHGDHCWASVNLYHALKDIKNKIEHLAEDNKITLGWTTASLSVAGASVGVALIPVVGLPISALMNAVPYFGRLTH
ncbi:hypothetical protein BgiBS90_019041, partial [Biomphalaria glabrata]